MKLEISIERFYVIGMVCFSIVGLMGLINLVIYWEINNIFSKISTIGSLIFDVALVLMFNYMRNMMAPEITEEYASDDVEEIINKIKKEGKK